jgi:hypothetical protein
VSEGKTKNIFPVALNHLNRVKRPGLGALPQPAAEVQLEAEVSLCEYPPKLHFVHRSDPLLL